MKKTKIKFILLGIILLTFFLPMFSYSFAEEDSYYNGVIQPNWLYFNVQDSNLNDRLRFTQGGIGIKSYENLGIYDRNPETNEIIFALKTVWTAQTQIYTTGTPTSMYPNLDTYNTNSYEFLTHVFRWASVETSRNHYYSTFNSIDLGDTFDPLYFNTEIPISVGLNPDFDSLAGTQIGKTTISGSSFAWEVKRVRVDRVLMDSVGRYDVNFTLPEDTSIDITASKQDDTVPDDQHAFSQASRNNLGCTITDTLESPIQAEIRDTTPVGNTWSNLNTGVFTFNDRIELQPKVSLLQHEVSTRYMRICSNYILFFGWDNYIEQGLTTYVSDVDSTSHPHITSGVMIDNYFIWKTYEININVLSTIQLTAEEYQESLDNPIFEQGDWIWNIHQGGTTTLDIVVPQNNPWDIFGNIGAWLWTIFYIIIAIIVLRYVVPVIIPLLKKNK